jgi:glycosyltransferase involved in cell wall biosynthesis
MRIGIDVRKYYDFGIGTYIQNLLHALDRRTEHDVVMFAAPSDERMIRQNHRGTVVVNSSSKYSLNELFTLSTQANAHHVDLFHAPHYTLPIGVQGKRIVTINDIIHLRFPADYSFVQRTYAYALMRHACAAAEAVLVCSEFTKGELLRRIPVSEKKVHVTYYGVSPKFGSDVDPIEMHRFWDARRVRQPVVLYVGSLKPHKNLPVLFDALIGVRKEVDARIVIVGERLENSPRLLAYARAREIDSYIISLGRVKAEELVMAYQSAGVVVLPSLYEGFGFPILEANASHTPVIGARAGSIPEVMGEGGLLFDPMDAHELATSILKVLNDASVRKTLIERGRRNVERFSWESCAEETLAIYEAVRNGR